MVSLQLSHKRCSFWGSFFFWSQCFGHSLMMMIIDHDYHHYWWWWWWWLFSLDCGLSFPRLVQSNRVGHFLPSGAFRIFRGRGIWWQHLEEPCCPAYPKSDSKLFEWHMPASECYQPLGLTLDASWKHQEVVQSTSWEEPQLCRHARACPQAQPSAASTASLKNLARCPRC